MGPLIVSSSCKSVCRLQSLIYGGNVDRLLNNLLYEVVFYFYVVLVLSLKSFDLRSNPLVVFFWVGFRVRPPRLLLRSPVSRPLFCMAVYWTILVFVYQSPEVFSQSPELLLPTLIRPFTSFVSLKSLLFRLK